MNRFASVVVLVTLAGPVLGQEKPMGGKLTLHPAAAPVPALRYRLLPDERERTPGNAALGYFRAFSPEWWPQVLRDPEKATKMDDARQLPLEQLPAEFQFVLESAQLRELDRAARRSYCDWEMTPRLREEGVTARWWVGRVDGSAAGGRSGQQRRAV